MIPKELDFNDVYQRFATAKNVYEHQDKIEARKNKCMVCNFGREGTTALNGVVEDLRKLAA